MPETKKKIEHTPGPWEARFNSSQGWTIWASVNLGRDENNGVIQPIYEVGLKPQLMVNPNGTVSASLSYDSWRQFPSVKFDEMQAANASLISAAPDLLAACQSIAMTFGIKDAIGQHRFNLLAEAIAKATLAQ